MQKQSEKHKNMYKSGHNFIYLLFYGVIANNFVFCFIGTYNISKNASDTDEQQKLTFEDYNSSDDTDDNANSLLPNRNQFKLNFYNNYFSSHSHNNRSDKLDEYFVHNGVFIDDEDPFDNATSTTSNHKPKGNLHEIFTLISCRNPRLMSFTAYFSHHKGGHKRFDVGHKRLICYSHFATKLCSGSDGINPLKHKIN